MNGELIYARSLTTSRLPDKHGNSWQYHPRSDNHSKIACWCVLYDLINSCDLLRNHIETKKIGFGINHLMHDYQNDRKKNLDLVICRPGGSFEKTTFFSLYEKYNLALSSKELRTLSSLPPFQSCPVGTTLLAVEAKACMTEHGKARPRLFDELASSYQVINGDTNNTIAAGYITINQSDYFISPLRNKKDLSREEAEISKHKTNVAFSVYEKIKQLKRRKAPSEDGYDAVGVTLLKMKNDGGPISVDYAFDSGQILDPIMNYETFITRLSTIYTTRLSAL